LVANALLSTLDLVDFWTTKCTNCPDALDKLNDLAADERYKSVKFASICCDSCDGAREIIEKNDSPRWDKVSHFFMDHEHKEEAKQILGFRQVPFYVVLNEEGEIVQTGSEKHIDFDKLPGMTQPQQKEEERNLDDAFQILDLDF
jgi:thiol-disulfide isomerase/thioredoxin